MIQKKEKNNIVEFVARPGCISPLRTCAVWKPGDPLGYIRKEKDTPIFEFPLLGGKKYDALVPDTLDLAERARIGLNVLTEATDPRCDYSMYFHVLITNSIIMMHDASDCCNSKYAESRPLLRLISGDTSKMYVDKIQLKSFLRKIGNDGLVWEPIKGQPWMNLGIDACGVKHDKQFLDQLCFLDMTGRYLGVAALHYLLTEDLEWRKVGERIVEGLRKIAVYRDDFAFYEYATYRQDTKVNQNAPIAKSAVAANAFWVLQGLAQFYKITGYEPAKELAGKLARHICWHSGIFDGGKFAYEHFHSQSLGVLGMVEYGLATQDKEILEFAYKCYEDGRSIGEPLIGYFPEFINNPNNVIEEPRELHTHESCEAADMIGIAIKLSQAGIADYWDDADRYIRNHFAEGQLLKGDWINDFAKGQRPTDVRPQETDKDVVKRNIGAFSGWSTPNEWWDIERQKWYEDKGIVGGEGSKIIMHCCTGNATRAIYYAWEGILEFSEGKLKINLLLNRASEWADINSYIPYEGRVDIHVKKNCDVMIRIPEWAKPEDIKCTVGGSIRNLSFEGRYAKLGSINAEKDIVLSFPISERVIVAKIANKNYSLTIKGNDVVDIDPAGKLCPIYQRQHYRSNKAKKIKVERFVPDKNIWW